MNRFLLLILFFVLSITTAFAQPDTSFTIGRLKYSGGGDWYSDPSSLPNLLTQLQERLNIDTAREETVIAPSDPNLFSLPMIYMTGHGTVRFSTRDIDNLREYFERGGMLWADDNYGMDESFRKEIRRVFPDSPLIELPNDHPVYSIYYHFDKGAPKIHEHHGGPPHVYAIYHKGRMAVLYTYNTDIGDGIESEGVHPEDSPETREQAMKMALNIVLLALSN